MDTSKQFRGDNRLLLGIVLGVITFWLFAQSLVNLVVPLQSTYSSDVGTINIAVSLSALFAGLFIVGAGDVADNLVRQNYLCRIDIKCCRFITHHHYTFASIFNYR